MNLGNAAPLGIALLGLLLGMRHATDPDHVIAVTTILSREHRIGAAARVGVIWGLGHTLMVLIVGAAIGALNGLIVVLSRIPDVVATLTSGFIWGGVALLILEKPGGGAPQEFLNLGAGTLFTPWLPNALVLLLAAVTVIWIPLRRSKLGLQLYAVGSDRIAAFRSGVNIDRTRFAAYIFSGLFSAVGGLGLTMTTGIGAPLAGVYYTLSGLAAVVVGGVSLAGGRGGMVGPLMAAFVLTLIPTDLIFLNIDPNFGQVIQGTLIVMIVMIGGFVDMARYRK